MKTIVSQRLYAVMPIGYTECKLNNINYRCKFPNILYNGTPTDYIMNFEASEFNYFCFNKNNKITTWPTARGEQPLSDNGKWKTEGRQEIKPGKFLLLFKDIIRVDDGNMYYKNEDEMRLRIQCGHTNDNGDVYTEDDVKLHATVRDKVIARLCEIFTDSLRASNTPLTFDTSEDVEAVYRMETHSVGGYLNNSCMRPGSGYDCSDYSGFYNHIPGLKIIHKTINNQLLFRALLWSCKDRDDNDVTFLDRIYGSEPTNLSLIEHAKENGWAWRHFNDSRIYHNASFIDLKVSIPNEAYEYLENEGSPYMDSLVNLTQGAGGWTLSNYMSGTYIQSCDGQAVSRDETCCECGCRVNEDRIYRNNNGDVYCSDCYYENYTCCEHCESDVDRNDMNNITLDGNDTYVCDSCLRYLYQCEECGNYFSDALSDLELCEDCEGNVCAVIHATENQMSVV